MTEILFVRHGEADYSIIDERKFIGHGRDLAPLTDKGAKQIEVTSTDLRLKDSELILSSPYTRALQSASILSSRLGIELKVEVDLHEWIPDIVNFDYKTSKDCFELCEDFERHDGVYPPNIMKVWESFEHMKERVDSVLENYRKYKKIIVVCHGMVIRTQRQKEKIKNGEIIEFKLV